MKDFKKTEENSWVVPVIDVGDGELAMEFSDELMEALSLNVGDTVVFKSLDEGHFSLEKKLT